MKFHPVFNPLMTHDLSCALGELGTAARRFTLPALLSSDRSATTDLAVAAVAFTVQLAIDMTDRDPVQMRALERELIAKLTSAPEVKS
jgi:hypothetical protein